MGSQLQCAHTHAPAPTPPCRNLLSLGFLIKYQKHLSLRVLVLQPLLITLIMLASTAALVSHTLLSATYNWALAVT
jgi:hypothetical protein